MPPIDVVADASVVLKWFHEEGEEGVADARALLDLHRDERVALSVLDLTAYEIGNALLRGRPAIAAASIAVILEALGEICPRLTLTSAELAEAASLAEQHRLTVYDGAYPAAARSRGGVLATADAALLKSGLGLRPAEIVADIEQGE